MGICKPQAGCHEHLKENEERENDIDNVGRVVGKWQGDRGQKGVAQIQQTATDELSRITRRTAVLRRAGPRHVVKALVVIASERVALQRTEQRHVAQALAGKTAERGLCKQAGSVTLSASRAASRCPGPGRNRREPWLCR